MLLLVRAPCCREHISAVPQERPCTCTAGREDARVWCRRKRDEDCSAAGRNVAGQDAGKGEWEMLNIIQNDFEPANTTYLDEDKVNLVVESVIETIKKGLPEEAQTVEALEFITDRIKERVKEKRIKL